MPEAWVILARNCIYSTIQGSLVRKMNGDILKLSKHVPYMAKPILKFNIFELETLLISCELDIPGVIALHGFLMKKSLSGGKHYHTTSFVQDKNLQN